ncbi:MAG TPA: adenylosuccinate synthase [Candidatus Acidoferrales bacterium]
MGNVVVVGAQWGDEGKGKVVDLLAEHFDVVARYQGGHNAGHTVVIGDKKFILQLVPSGILRPGKWAVIGPGVVIDPNALCDELQSLRAAGVEPAGRLFISNRAHLIFPYHQSWERTTESARGADKLGTTCRGIGPAYEDKMRRRGVRVADLLRTDLFSKKVATVLAENEALFRSSEVTHPINPLELIEEYLGLGAKIAPFVTDTTVLLSKVMQEGKSVLFEGAQGTMLDIDHGTYPFVTSSNASAGGACTGLGMPPTRISAAVGVTKAYTTRVGSGPFPTEVTGEIAQQMRERGNEYGAVTGRPRRCGWLDLMVLRYSAMINGLDSWIVTKLDILDSLAEIPVCTGYRCKGALVTEMPATAELFEELTPIYQNLAGWQSSTLGINEYSQLPQRARDYLRFISDQTGVEIGLVSTGPERGQSILVRGSRLEKFLP